MDSGKKWTQDEKRRLLEAFTVISTIQNNYGKEINILETLKGWEFILADSFTGDQVLAALKTFVKKSNSIPTPSDLIKIMEPEDDKITHEEYKHALRQWELEGKLPHSHWKAMALAYEDQQAGLDYADRYRIKNQEHAARIANMGQIGLIEKSGEN